MNAAASVIFLAVLDAVVAPAGERARVCQLAADKGVCVGTARGRSLGVRHHRYAYNAALGRCQPFVYSGCGGNANRFHSALDCRTACLRVRPANAANDALSDAACALPPERGEQCPDGRGGVRFYWNAAKWACLVFRFDGCDGNANNFATNADCQAACRPMDGPTCAAGAAGLVATGDGERRPECADVPCPQSYTCVEGAFFAECCPDAAQAELLCKDGSEPHEKDHYAEGCQNLDCPDGFACEEGTVFSKCCRSATNENKGSESVVASGTSMASRCLAEPSVGTCEQTVHRYYFDRTSGRCLPFVYSGCGGTANRFYSRLVCERDCLPIAPAADDPLISPLEHTRFPGHNGTLTGAVVGVERCEQPAETGLCRASMRRWFFNSQSGVCEPFVYGGCGGNANNFESPAACADACAHKQAAAGPCEPGNRRRTPFGYYSPQCNSAGYFELVQCDSATGQCWCADTLTGAEVAGTRVKSASNTKPSCSECHLQKYYAFSLGSPPPGAYVPQCQASGEFERRQCHSSSGQCWCVDADGVEIKQTRRNAGQQPPDCRNPAPTAELVEEPKPTALPVPPSWGDERCSGRADGGFACKQSKGRVQWRFDGRHRECVAFYFAGCGGSANRFDSPTDCSTACKIQDASPCYGEPLDSLPDLCYGPEDCKDDRFVCVAGAFFGHCCNKTIQDVYDRSYNPDCKAGKLVEMDMGGWAQPLLGTTCDDGFCPDGSACVQLDMFAHCCADGDLKHVVVASSVDEKAGGLQSDVDRNSVTGGGSTPVANECTLSLSRGRQTCRRAPRLRYHFDAALGECLAFEYSGCGGGNANNFDTLADCQTSCRLPDTPTCAGNNEPVADSQPCWANEQCPQGAVCRAGAFFGSCCDAVVEALYDRNYSPTCGSGGVLVETDSGGYASPLLGADCSHDFCPAASVCYQGEIFAYCCIGGQSSPLGSCAVNSGGITHCRV